MTGICNVTCAESPLDLDGSEDYDLSPDGSKVVFNSKDIDLPLANYTSSQIWYVPFDGSAGDAVRINARGATSYFEAQGASLSPRFSPNGDYIAYVQQNGIFYESDRTILYFANADPANFNATALAKNWDRSPDIGAWGRDSATIFTSASDLGRVRIFPVPLTAGDSYEPENITDEGATAAYYTLPNGSLLVSDSKLWSSRDIYTTTPDGKVTKTYFQANLVDPELAGLGPEDVSEFHYSTNTSEIKQQSWIVFPEGFDSTKKYPLAFITHGGPQGGQYNSIMCWANLALCHFHLREWAGALTCATRCRPVRSCAVGVQGVPKRGGVSEPYSATWLKLLAYKDFFKPLHNLATAHFPLPSTSIAVNRYSCLSSCCHAFPTRSMRNQQGSRMASNTLKELE